MSVLYPILFTRFIRAGLRNVSAERLEELYPGVDVVEAHERFQARYRLANAVVVALGLLLFGWLIRYMQRPDWDGGAVGGMVTAYFLLQNAPILMTAWLSIRFNKLHRRVAPETKRKATLQPRRLFDFVSPLTVLIAILAYFQYAAIMFYVDRHPFPGFAGPLPNIAILTVGYLLLGFVVAYFLRRKKKNPLHTHSDHRRIIGGVATYYIWCLILTALSLSLQALRKIMDLETWGPAAGTVFFLILTLLNLRTMRLTPPQPEPAGFGSSPAR